MQMENAKTNAKCNPNANNIFYAMRHLAHEMPLRVEAVVLVCWWSRTGGLAGITMHNSYAVCDDKKKFSFSRSRRLSD